MLNNKYIIIGIGFLVTLFANTFLAMFVLQNFSSSLLISRTMEQGLNFPALLSGYFLVAVFMYWLNCINKKNTYLRTGVENGLATALAFNVAGYLVVAGWSIASAPHMLLASIVDSFATVFGSVVIAYLIYKR
jgi:hypothetical protein